MQYAPYASVTGTDHIVVDGAAQDGTVLTLSHWPGSHTPAALRRDLSAEIAFAYLDHPELRVDADLVTNNHPDEDGIASVFVLVEPDAARARRELVVEIARAGDFSTTASRHAARCAFAISSMIGMTSQDPYPVVLDQLAELIDGPEHYHDLWSAEDDTFQSSLDALAGGIVTIEEHPEIDLAVVRVPAESPRPHAMAIHNATDRFRILYLHGNRYELVFRYETWVQFVSRPVMPRVDLGPLAARLSDLDGGAWTFDGAGSIIPSLRRADRAESTIAPDRFVVMVHTALTEAPAAWDPFP